MISIRIQSKNNVCSLSLSKYPLLLSKLGGWVKEDVGCKTGTLHCCCRVDATADSRSRLLRLQNKPNILPFVCKKCSSCQKTCISATVRLHPYVTLGYDCLLDPSWDCLMAPNQSASTSISVAEKLLSLVWFGLVYDYGLWSEDPSRDCLMAPYQSASTSIGLTSGWGYPLKNLPYSCKYSNGEALKQLMLFNW